MSSLAGTGALVRLALRRDRVVIAVFLVVLVIMVAASADATVKLYPTGPSRGLAAAAVNGSTAVLALYGPIHDTSSIGALATFKMGIMGAISVAVLALLLVVRHTRTEEETGRLELLGAGVVGRRAPLTAALLEAAGVSLVAGAVTALGLAAAGLPLAGSALMGLGFACLGIALAAVAGVTAQLFRSARAASGLAGILLGVAYLVRGIGDASAGDGLGWLSWLSPVGWWQQTRAYAGDRWWVPVLPLAFAALAAALAYGLAARRDFAAGLLPDRPGPATATAGLRSPLALAWRLQRGTFVAWAAAFLVLGVVIGGLSASAGTFITSQQVKDFITSLGGEKMIRDAFLAVELGMSGIFAAVYGVQATLRLRSEETALRAEPVLTASVGRRTWAWSHLAIALAGSAALLVILGVSAGISSAVQLSDGGQVGRIVLAGLVQIPAVWVTIGIAAAAFGLVPRLTSLAWAALAAFVLVGEFGPLFKLDQIVMDLSPFTHVPRMPGAAFAWAPMLWLTAVAAGFIALGLVGFRRRDVG